MRKIIGALILFTSLILTTSSYIVKALPERTKKVCIKPFKNIADEVNLETEFTNAIIEEMLKDGRICLVYNEEEADGILIVIIKKYFSEPFVHSREDSKKVAFLVEVDALFRNKENVVLWSGSNMTMMHVSDNDNLRKARKELWEKLSRSIIRSMVKCFN